MADWFVDLYDRSQGDGTEFLIGSYSLMEPEWEIRNSEPGGFSGAIALSQTDRRTNAPIPGGTNQASSFAPYRTNYELWRDGTIISAGMLTSTNLNFNRDTLLVAGKDWLHYLQRRIYPFDPELYVAGGWTRWPRRWPDTRGTHGPNYYHDPTPIDVSIIVRELVMSMRWSEPTDIDASLFPVTPEWPQGAELLLGAPPITQNVAPVGLDTTYVIQPGDQTSIFDHITKLSEQTDKGFEFDILPRSLEFKMYAPRRDVAAYPWYWFFPNDEQAINAISAFDWTNDGPEGTYIIGLGEAEHKVGRVWAPENNLREFGRHDKVYDFGKIPDADMLLQMIKDQNDLHPQRKLELQLLNPQYMTLNFYSSGRPRSLMGARVWVSADFRPYRFIDAGFRINAIRGRVDGSTNEYVDLELEMIYE